jgi:hypothetical protein
MLQNASFDLALAVGIFCIFNSLTRLPLSRRDVENQQKTVSLCAFHHHASTGSANGSGPEGPPV